MSNNYTLESFISFCDDMMIAEEGLKDIFKSIFFKKRLKSINENIGITKDSKKTYSKFYESNNSIDHTFVNVSESVLKSLSGMVASNSNLIGVSMKVDIIDKDVNIILIMSGEDTKKYGAMYINKNSIDDSKKLYDALNPWILSKYQTCKEWFESGKCDAIVIKRNYESNETGLGLYTHKK